MGRDPNIFFQNARLSALAPKQHEVSPRHVLPDEIFFILYVATYRCTYPLPEEYPEERYLHRATTLMGYEAAGPAVHLNFDPSTVVGLRAHQMVGGSCPFACVLEVPVTRRLNKFLTPCRLTFQPASPSQLHSSRQLPRIIVPIYSVGPAVRAGLLLLLVLNKVL